MVEPSLDGEDIDAPEAPTYEAPPDVDGVGDWTRWPFWAKLRFLYQLQTIGNGREQQYIDDTLSFYVWLLLGGRGGGKGWSASHKVAEWGLHIPRRIALVARTIGDARDTMIEGETGLLALIPNEALRGGSRSKAYNRSLGELYLANGTKFKTFTSEKPAALRGPQFHKAWVDEASSFEDADLCDPSRGPEVDTTMSNLMLGLRLGDSAQMIVSTTPKPNGLTKFLDGHKRSIVRVITTYDNLSNLAPEVAEVVIGLYEGTSVGAQELEGRILDEAKGAAWTTEMVQAARSATPPAVDSVWENQKTVLGVDPAVSSGGDSDETGLVIVRKFTDKELQSNIRILDDQSGKVDVGSFGARVLGAVSFYDVDEVVVEINNGYDFVVRAITSVIEDGGGTVVRRMRKDLTSSRTKSRQVVEYLCELEDHSFVIKPVWQSADKLTRAKAISVWWHRGRATHAEGLEKLEGQMATFDGTGKKSPDRLDALTSAVAALASGRPITRGRGGASPLDLMSAVASAATPVGSSGQTKFNWAQRINT